MKEFRTEEYRMYPDKAQRSALEARLNLADSAFDHLADLANTLAWSGESSDAIALSIRNQPLFPGLDPTEDLQVKHAITRLVPRLASREILSIFHRNRHRMIRTLSIEASKRPKENVYIRGIGYVFLALHRPLPLDAHVFRISIKADCCGDKYYLLYSYFCERADAAPHPIRPEHVVGLDYTQDGLYVDSEGNCAEYPGFRQLGKAKLSRYRQNVKRFQKGSNRWRKHQRRLAKCERHIEKQRADWQYKKAAALSLHYDAVCQETLDFHAMIDADPRLAAKIYDNDLPAFSRKLASKMKQQGKQLVQVSQYYPSSQFCFHCGTHFGPQPLYRRHFLCPNCGMEIDRDINAARNIKEEGLRLMLAA